MRKLLLSLLLFVLSKVVMAGCYYDFSSYRESCDEGGGNFRVGTCVYPDNFYAPQLNLSCIPSWENQDEGYYLWVNHCIIYSQHVTHFFKVCSNPEPPKSQTIHNADSQKNSCGSIIQVDNQVLVEKIPLIGTNYNITYSSQRVEGRKDWYKIFIPITRSDHVNDFNVLSEELEIEVAGRVFNETFSQSSGLSYLFNWDGKDNDNQSVYGSVPLKITVYERYTGLFVASYPVYTNEGVNAVKSTSSISTKYVAPVISEVKIGTIFRNNRTLGGWYFNEQHLYDDVRETLYLGDGTTYNTKAVIKTNGDRWLISEDRTQVFVFNSDLVHIKTLDALTGITELTLSYDGSGKLISVVDKFSNQTTFNYSGDDLISIVSQDGHITSFSHDINGFIATAINPNLETHNMTYSSDGLLLSFQKPNGVISTFTYDPDGLLLADSSSAGSSTTLDKELLTGTEEGEYKVIEESALGRKQISKILRNNGSYNREEAYPNGYFSNYIELSNHQGNSIVESNGLEFSQNFQNDNRFGLNLKMPSYFYFKDGGQSKYSYYSELYSLTDPEDPFSFSTLTSNWQINGQNYTSTYSPSLNQIVETSPLGKNTTIVLGSLGEVVSIEPNAYEAISIDYDSRGRLTEISQGVDRTTLFSYHPTTGFLESIENALGETTSFTHDGVGRVLSTTIPDSRVFSYSYDAIGNITSITPPGRSAHTMIYSGHGPLATYTPPSLGSGSISTNYFYSADRELIQINRPNGDEIEFNYGVITGNLDSIYLPNGNRTFTYNNGVMSQSNSEDFVVRSMNVMGSKVINDVISISGLNKTIQSSYNNNFLLTNENLFFSSGFSYLSFNYDNDLFLTSAGSQTYTRSPVNGSISSTNLNDVEEIYTYSSSFGELASHIAKYQTTTLYEMSVERDNLGRITSKTEKYGASAPNTYGYTYDLAGRLTQVSLNGNPKSVYSYDSNSNRTSQEIDSVTTLATYDEQDRLLTFGSKTFTYNLNGELTSMSEGSDTTDYTYDAFGNLKQVETPTLTVNYKVDAHDRRVQKLHGTTAIEYYVWNAENQLLATLNDLGNLKARFVYGSKSHAPDYMIKDGVEYKIVSDHLGSPVVVVNSTTGVVAQEVKYDEFGKILSDTNPGFTPFGFAGCLYDQDTKLCRFGARDYDATIGRWLSKDPILFAGGDTNLYGYVLQDPVNLIDPSGNIAIALIPLAPIIMKTGNIAAAAILSHALSKSLPLKGPPNGSEVLPDNKGGKKQERFYDSNGYPLKDIDWGHDHGVGNPHIHDWFPVPGKIPKRGPGRPPREGEC